MKAKTWFLPSSRVLQYVTGDIGFPSQSIILWYAKYGAGKSTLLLDLAYDFYAQTGKRVLWIDTEGGMDVYVKLNDAVLRAKYLSKRDKGDPVVLRNITDLVKIFSFLGMKVNIERSDGSVAVKYEGDETVQDPKDRRRKIPYSEMVELIKKEGVGMIVVDSVTMPFRAVFSGGRENLPARSSAYSLLLGKIMALAMEFDLIVFITAHESLVPTVNYERDKPVGAEVMKYYSKFWYQIEKLASSNEKLSCYRRIYQVRFPNLPDWSRKGVIKFTEKGMVDSSEDEIEETRKEIQKEREKK